jgi:sugar lactone lactonase YvrE
VKTTLALALCALAATLRAADPPRSVLQLQEDAQKAYERGDKAAFLKDYEQAARLRPGDVWILYNLACARSINGQTEAAVAALREFVAHRLAADLAADKDFDAIRQTAGYEEVVAQMDALRKERVSSGAAVAFTIPRKEIAAEGVAYDAVLRAFFIASVRQGEILRIGQDGKISVFVPPGAGLRSPLGMGADAKRRRLWVANEIIPHMNGGKEGDPPNSTLFAFDLDSGREVARFEPPPSPEPPHFDDLTVASDGRVYVNDGFHPRIYSLGPGDHALVLWLESDVLDGGTQGLSTTPDAKTLYVSDYRGLYRVDVAAKAVSRLPDPPDLTLAGADGLIYSEGRLVIVQNGVQPNRVSLLELSPDGTRITRDRILEMNHPLFDEPTLGTVVDGVFYFSANNQGHRYHDVKNPPKPGDLQDAVILRVDLKAK